MKKLLLTALLVALSVPVFADTRAVGSVHCNCVELERRLRGLENALYYAPISSDFERRDIQRQMREGEKFYAQGTAWGTSQNDQERLCSLGAVAVDRSWVRWQPWLAQHGYDKPHYCENQDPGNVPYNGDAGCPNLAWKTVARTQRAIVIREGANQAHYYRVVGIAGSSCYRYVPR